MTSKMGYVARDDNSLLKGNDRDVGIPMCTVS
jgi:hypothetical protein